MMQGRGRSSLLCKGWPREEIRREGDSEVDVGHV